MKRFCDSNPDVLMSSRAKLSLAIIILLTAAMLFMRSGAPEMTPANQLLCAAHHGDLSGVQAAIARGATVNDADEVGITPLIEAARAGHPQMCADLIRAGADVN